MKGTSKLNSELTRHIYNPWVLISIVIAFGGLNLAIYYDIPIVRNAAIYARISYSLLDFGFDFSVRAHAFNKALGFPFISLPFVALWNANVGLKLSSFVWSTLWVISQIIFFRRLQQVFLVDEEKRPTEALYLVVLLLNPLIIYQFISAYPDTLNALTFLWALYFLDRMTSKSCRWYDGPLFALITILAIWIKHHGFVILAMLLIFSICRYQFFKWQWNNGRKTMFGNLVALMVLCFVIGVAQSGRIPIFNLSHNTGNYSGGFSRMDYVIGANLNNFKNYFLVTFTILTPFLFRWRCFLKYKEWYIAMGVFVVTVLVYVGATINMRYFIPISPLFAWIICSNLSFLKQKTKTILVAWFIFQSLFLSFYYNNISFYKIVNSSLKKTTKTVGRLQTFDNIRLTDTQYQAQIDIDAINNHIEDDRNTLFFTRLYYGKGLWYIWERGGLFADNLNVVYQPGLDWEFIEKYAQEHKLKKALLYEKSVSIEKQKQYKPQWIEMNEISASSFKLNFLSPADP